MPPSQKFAKCSLSFLRPDLILDSTQSTATQRAAKVWSYRLKLLRVPTRKITVIFAHSQSIGIKTPKISSHLEYASLAEVCRGRARNRSRLPNNEPLTTMTMEWWRWERVSTQSNNPCAFQRCRSSWETSNMPWVSEAQRLNSQRLQVAAQLSSLQLIRWLVYKWTESIQIGRWKGPQCWVTLRACRVCS